MALPNEIQVGRYNRFVQKLLSIKGRATTFLASPELDFVLPLFHGAENRYLEGWDLYGRFATVAPVAASSATATLRNPVGSNVIAVVTRIFAQEATPGNSGTGLITWFRPGTAGANAGDETTIVPTQGIDGRGRTASTCVLSHNAGTAQVARVGGVLIANMTSNNVATEPTLGDVFRPGDELPLTPGEVMTVSAGTVTEGMNYFIWWRERFLEDSERA